MKRIATSILTAGFTAATIAASPLAFAEGTDLTFYGSVRSGIIHTDSDGGTDATWDLGSLDADNPNASDTQGPGKDRLWSRIGVKASHDLGNGMTGGLHIEKRLDRFRTRHQNVYLSGDFGKITLGQQGTVYQPATSWDGAWLLGGNTQLAGSRAQGIKYSSALDGPFNFNAMISDDGSNADASGGGLDVYEVSASFSMADIATAAFGYRGQDDRKPDFYGGTVGGSITGFDWEVGYEKSNGPNEPTNYGAFASYGGGYVSYEDYNSEDNTKDEHYLIFGYSRALGTNTRFVIEHRRPDADVNTTALALIVNF